MSTRWTLEIFENKLNDYKKYHNCEPAMSLERAWKEYRNQKTKLIFDCLDSACRSRFEKALGKMYQGCPKCQRRKARAGTKLKYEKFKRYVLQYEKEKNVALLMDVKDAYEGYENNRTKLLFRCENVGCGNVYRKPLGKFHQGCTVCGYKEAAQRRRLNKADFEERFRERGYKLLSPYKLYKNNRSPLRIEDEFGRVHETTLGRFSEMSPCIPSRSILEFAVKTVVEDMFFPFIFQTVRPKWLEGLEIDLYNRYLNIAIEVDGIQHIEFTPRFHKSKRDFEAQVDRDERTNELCSRNLVQLLRINVLQLKYRGAKDILRKGFVEDIYNHILDGVQLNGINVRPLQEIIGEERLFLNCVGNKPIVKKSVQVCDEYGWDYIEIIPLSCSRKANYLVGVLCKKRGHYSQKTIGNLKNHGCRECVTLDRFEQEKSLGLKTLRERYSEKK